MIHKLPQNLVEKIAAGEVVERPASIVKELLENALDAGADTITIRLRDGGAELIEVSDNGCGIASTELAIAIEPHTTSKIANEQDLFAIQTLGFRGEALASICAVSKTTVTSKTKNETAASQISVEGGVITQEKKVGASVGTTVCVQSLFYNVPARKKFLKTVATETTAILQVVTPYCIANESLHVEVWHNEKQILLVPKGDLQQKCLALYGSAVAKYAKRISYSVDNILTLTGLTSDPMHTRSDKSAMTLIVNNRWIKNPQIIQAIAQGYGQLLMGGRYPIGIYKLTLNAQSIDVNIHPSKDIIKFENETVILNHITQAITQTFAQKELIRDTTPQASIASFAQTQTNLAERDSEYKSKQISQQKSHTPTQTHQTSTQQQNTQMQQTSTYQQQTQSPKQPEFTKPILTQGVLASTPTEILVDSSHMRYLGLINRTYAVLEENGGIILVDFHAAHERYLYELLKKDLTNPKTATQSLLAPIHVTLSPNEMHLALSQKETLEQSGFIFDEFGVNTILLRSVPKIFHKQMKPEFFTDVLSSIHKSTDIADSIMIRMSCRAADKAGDDLSDEKIKSIIRQVASEGHKYSCPHGRPIFVRISQMELEKMFKRRV